MLLIYYAYRIKGVFYIAIISVSINEGKDILWSSQNCALDIFMHIS